MTKNKKYWRAGVCILLLFCFSPSKIFGISNTYLKYPLRHCFFPEKNIDFPLLRMSFKQENERGFRVSWDLPGQEKIFPVGSEIRIVRCLPPGRWVAVGNGQVTGYNGLLAEAHIFPVEEDGREPLKNGNFFNRPMVGDLVLPVERKIARHQTLTPKYFFSIAQLFIGYGTQDFSYELSEVGKNLLDEAFSSFAGRGDKVLIEGFSSSEGQREELRRKSLMFSQAIAAYLMSRFQLDPSALVAIGYGSDKFEGGMRSMDLKNKHTMEPGVVLRVFPKEFNFN